ncbi:hypothetical protein CBR_g39891 [Chara braunii]|uniref:Uncharacterized protein n=1 Tax=Chara braunii TaxID=69332 RepID=A0A388LSL5_CHABU|nr:hypothetical protein CBR_g39891 [Chara braunii]|eukprot:GBG85324.1 hypothetical protein CBR_g39891 [Chara braunii]
MESLLAKAVESKLKAWLKSFSRDQFRLLQGRTMLLSNLDLNGKTLHACLGLPPSLRVTQARVGKLEIQLPSVSNVKSDPVVVSINRLDIVLCETLTEAGDSDSTGSDASSGSSSNRNSTYGFSDKVADGVTVNVGELNIMLETLGSAGSEGADAASWTPPLASITMRGVMLYTTNEYWQAVNLKETRQFFHGKKFIYIFKKLEWESLSIDLLPHPKMFSDERVSSSARGGSSSTDPEDARRWFFGGERLVDNIYGTANITQLRSLHNEPIGLEVELNVSEVLCPALSEPDFRLELILQSLSYSRASAGGTDFVKSLARLEISGLFFRDTYTQPPCTLIQPSMRGSAGRYEPPPEFARGGFFARVYPLASPTQHESPVLPMFQLFAAQTSPCPAPPEVTSHVFLRLQPMKINLQEDSCLRMASLLSDGAMDAPVKVVKEPILKSIQIHLEELDITLPLKDTGPSDAQQPAAGRQARQRGRGVEGKGQSGFTGAQLYIDGLSLIHDPSLKYRVLQMDKDAACYLFWEGQPADNSQWRFAITAVSISAALETGRCDDLGSNVGERTSGLWRCLEVQNPCVEVAMATQDGSPITVIPPPGGVLRVGFKCQQLMSNTSREQLLFALRMILHMGKVTKKFMKIGKILRKKVRVESPVDVRQVLEEAAEQRFDEDEDEDYDDDEWDLDGSSDGSATDSRAGSDNKSIGCARSSSSMPRNAGGVDGVGELATAIPGDSGVTILVEAVEMRLLESVPGQIAIEGPLLGRVMAAGLGAQAKFRSLEGAAAITWNVMWRDIRVELVDTESTGASDRDADLRALEREGLSSEGIVKFLNWGIAGDKKSRSRHGSRGSRDSGALEVVDKPRQPPMRAVFWTKGKDGEEESSAFGQEFEGRQPLLEASMVHVIPYVDTGSRSSVEGKVQVTGVRVGGGMEYNEALLHRFGVLDEDGGPGEAVKRILKILSKKQFSEFLRKLSKDPSPRASEGSTGLSVGMPDELNVELQLVDWAFLLERVYKPGPSRPGSSGGRGSSSGTNRSSRYSRHWHMGFRKVQVVADSAAAPSPSVTAERPSRPWKIGRYKSLPFQALKVKVEGLVVVKPQDLETPPKMENGANVGLSGRSRENWSGHMANSVDVTSPTYPGAYASPAHPSSYSSPSRPTSFSSPPLPAAYTSTAFSGSPYGGSAHSSSYSPSVPHHRWSSSQGLPSAATLEAALGKFHLADHSGVDLEFRLGAREGSGLLGGEKAGVDWILESVKMGIKEPLEIEATKVELKSLVELFTAEIQAAGRIGQGALKLLQRSAPVAQLVVEKLEANQGYGQMPNRETASPLKDLAYSIFGEDFGPARRFSKKGTEQPEEGKWRDRLMEAEMMLLKSQSLCFQIRDQLSLGADAFLTDRGRGAIAASGGVSELDLGPSRKVAELAAQLESLQTLLEKIGE